MEAGAHRPLIESLVSVSSSPLSQDAMPVTAAALRCLATSPRLPAMDWGALCRKLWVQATLPTSISPNTRSSTTAAAIEAGVSLQRAIVALVVAHGAESSHNLGPFLVDLMLGLPPRGGLSVLHPSVLAALLRQLTGVLRCLAGSRHIPLLAALLPEVQGRLQRGGTFQVAADGASVLEALWQGLTGLQPRPLKKGKAAAGEDEFGVAQPIVSLDKGILREVMVGALSLLPALPPLLPGEIAWIRVALTGGEDDIRRPHFDNRLPGATLEGERERLHLIWIKATQCFIAAGPAVSTEMLSGITTRSQGGGRIRCSSVPEIAPNAVSPGPVGVTQPPRSCCVQVGGLDVSWDDPSPRDPCSGLGDCLSIPLHEDIHVACVQCITVLMGACDNNNEGM